MKTARSRVGGAVRVLALAATVGATSMAFGAPLNADAHPVPAPLPAATRATSALSGADVLFLDSLVGRSHKLRAFFVSTTHPSFAIDLLQRLFGDSAANKPGVYTLNDSLLTDPISLITLVPFSQKLHGRIGSYRLGFWPYERRTAQPEMYANPDGFVEVTPANEDVRVSEHFALRDFLTHDQEDIWPKYLVLDDKLVDKLELVIEDLTDHGVRVDHMTVMSGFRTPEYNREGLRHGRVRDSRHQYGDAADVFVDNTGSGRMSDLNHDGRVNWRDAKIIRDAVDRVEAAHPELAGGAGIYRATSKHGPFLHIDARGVRTRWGRG